MLQIHTLRENLEEVKRKLAKKKADNSSTGARRLRSKSIQNQRNLKEFYPTK